MGLYRGKILESRAFSHHRFVETLQTSYSGIENQGPFTFSDMDGAIRSLRSD